MNSTLACKLPTRHPIVWPPTSPGRGPSDPPPSRSSCKLLGTSRTVQPPKRASGVQTKADGGAGQPPTDRVAGDPGPSSRDGVERGELARRRSFAPAPLRPGSRGHQVGNSSYRYRRAQHRRPWPSPREAANRTPRSANAAPAPPTLAIPPPETVDKTPRSANAGSAQATLAIHHPKRWTEPKIRKRGDRAGDLGCFATGGGGPGSGM